MIISRSNFKKILNRYILESKENEEAIKDELLDDLSVKINDAIVILSNPSDKVVNVTIKKGQKTKPLLGKQAEIGLLGALSQKYDQEKDPEERNKMSLWFNKTVKDHEEFLSNDKPERIARFRVQKEKLKDIINNIA